MNAVAQMIDTLRNIENAAILGVVPGVLTAIEAGMLRLELTDSETQIEAMERAEHFVQWVNRQVAKA